MLAARPTTVSPVAGRAASLPPTKGFFVNRLWSRVGVRATSVGLLAAGLAGGLYLGQDREVQQQNTEAQLVVQADVDEMQLLKQRQSQHAAARAWQRQAESDAAEKAAAVAKAAAGKAHKLELQVIAEKKAAEAAAEEAAARKKAEESGGPVPFTGPIPSSCAEYSGSREIGCTLMLQAGFGISQFPCLDNLWTKESGWNYRAENTSSGAYGIPQALPGDKMAVFGDDWRTNPATQIKWGLDYIENRYGTPCNAWSHSQSTGWY